MVTVRDRAMVWALAILAGLAMVVGVSPALAGGSPRPPNIILIVADDLGWGDVGFNGRREWATPNLDRLARQGTVLRRCYAAAAVCAPSRAAFLTGRCPIHTGVRRNDQDLPAEEVTIAEVLQLKGYTTALFGKWHHGKPRAGRRDYVHPMDQGFDAFFGYADAADAWEKFPEALWDGRRRVAVSGYFDDLITDRAVEFLGARQDRPFFLYLAPTATHFHIDAPADEVARHRGKVPETNPAQPLNATYAAMVTRLDRNVGRVVEALERLHRTGETLIVFTSDNGATFESGNQGTSAALDSNRPFRGQKRTLWEGGIRVPALACWPGTIPAGVISDEAVQLTDLLPTFAAAAGAKLDPSRHLDGVNQLPHWTGLASAVERTLFWEWDSEGTRQLAAMRGRHKLVITAGGKPELYDIVGDPAERRDLSAQYPDLTRQLRTELHAWFQSATPR
ncbi:MAG TPA: sulfatase-like hydrolase/transferase [Isosphaeraceae bacterium]|nr:sulfatase-like hydrolase/transferase [Isosphaeraceae bacterium]